MIKELCNPSSNREVGWILRLDLRGPVASGIILAGSREPLTSVPVNLAVEGITFPFPPILASTAADDFLDDGTPGIGTEDSVTAASAVPILVDKEPASGKFFFPRLFSSLLKEAFTFGTEPRPLSPPFEAGTVVTDELSLSAVPLR